jgi:uncharacterized protein
MKLVRWARSAEFAGFLFALFLGSSSGPARSQSFECSKAATAVERSVCADERLKRLDADLAANYRSVVKQVVPGGARALRASQRAWIADRNARCATGAGDCLTAEYQERNAVLLALLARTSDENPVIDAADPAILSGAWVVSSDTRDTAGGSKRVATAAHLPPSGARLVAMLGKLCVVEPADAKICSPFGLAVETASHRGKRGDPSVASGSVVMLAYFDGRADFELILGATRELTASFLACEGAAKNCQWMSQRWIPQSPNAGVKMYPVFD